MGKIPTRRLQEILFGSSDKAESAKLAALDRKGEIKKIAPKIYTSNLEEDPAIIIKRNWYQILNHQYPQAILSHRSALEYRPTPNGHIYLTYSYTNNIELPGMTIHLLKGPNVIEGDKVFFEELYVSQETRAFLENLQSSRKEGEESKSLPQSQIEEKLELLVRVRGEQALNDLRDTARNIAPILKLEKEFEKLNRLISALLSTAPSKNLQSPVSLARVLGEPFDAGRIDLFENLYNELAGQFFPEFPERNLTRKAHQNFSFFESYFSNYIEGTEFEIDEAKNIITTSTPLPARYDDSHDILGTYQIVSDKSEMSIIPNTSSDLLELLKQRHAILLRARTEKKPGQFKDLNNRAGNTEFVDWQLVPGTLKKGFEWYSLLQHPFAKAAYMMFLISEIHPFLDGNGRIGRVMMNAELSSRGQSKIIIPTVFREDYIGALKNFTNQRTPDAYARMLLRAWEFSSNIIGEDLDLMEDYLNRCDAFKEPKHGQLKKITSEIVTPEWSNPKAITYGKNVVIRSPKGDFEIQILNATGSMIGKFFLPMQKRLVIQANEISAINPQMIRFKAQKDEVYAEYELFD